ncbi:MAG: hypothetical protein AB7G47_19680 [Mycolicibacterium sp.]|uniref:hypothetical protein n=1 Tax=Mycolicibacterium sp. TaxID=2320850 RepID=UPI003D12FB9C
MINRPYTFELAALLLDGPQESVHTTAQANGVDLDQLTRAAEILTRLQAAGEDINEWVRREYIIDGWLHGYLPLQASPADPALTTWKLAQHAEAFYRQSATP